MAAILCDASTTQQGQLESFGKHIGFAFQLADDLLDADEDAEEDGPPSFVKLLGETETATQAEQAMSLALESLKGFNNANALRELAKFTVQRTF